MMPVHNYKFILTGKSYNEGWDRIFGKKKIKKTKKERKPRRKESK